MRDARMSIAGLAVIVATSMAVGGCSSGSGSTSSSTDAPTSAVGTAAPSSSPETLSGTAPASTPATTSATRPTSAVRSSAPPAPLSRFENDPGVRAFRAWAAEAARTVNTGHDDSGALRKLMTASFAKTMPHVLGSDVGKFYPGPIPYRPLRITVVDSTHRASYGCSYNTGFAENKKTHKPAEAVKIIPIEVLAVRHSGRWIVDNTLTTTRVSCKDVTVRTQRW